MLTYLVTGREVVLDSTQFLRENCEDRKSRPSMVILNISAENNAPYPT